MCSILTGHFRLLQIYLLPSCPWPSFYGHFSLGCKRHWRSGFCKGICFKNHWLGIKWAPYMHTRSIFLEELWTCFSNVFNVWWKYSTLSLNNRRQDKLCFGETREKTSFLLFLSQIVHCIKVYIPLGITLGDNSSILVLFYLLHSISICSHSLQTMPPLCNTYHLGI